MKKRVLHLVKIYTILLIIFVSYFFINKYTGFYIPCYIKAVTGYDCPGCGITRCLFALIQFRFKEAFFYNPLVFIYLPFIVSYFIYQSYLYLYEKKDRYLVKIPNYIRIIILIITLLYGVLRNVF